MKKTFLFLREILSPELLGMAYIFSCAGMVALAFWIAGRDISQAQRQFNHAAAIYHKDHEDSLRAFQVVLERLKEVEDQTQKMRDERTTARLKMSDEEFWEASALRDYKMEECRKDGHVALPIRQGWGVLCIRKDAVIWSE